MKDDDMRERRMTDHKTGTRQEWLAARLELLEAEKALTRRSDELARQRRELPWVRVEKDYRFATEDGDASLRDLLTSTPRPQGAVVIPAQTARIAVEE
jgi:predicted dithiol-disulfide oxidoreductase (DUF899 family)